MCKNVKYQNGVNETVVKDGKIIRAVGCSPMGSSDDSRVEGFQHAYDNAVADFDGIEQIIEDMALVDDIKLVMEYEDLFGCPLHKLLDVYENIAGEIKKTTEFTGKAVNTKMDVFDNIREVVSECTELVQPLMNIIRYRYRNPEAFDVAYAAALGA